MHAATALSACNTSTKRNVDVWQGDEAVADKNKRN